MLISASILSANFGQLDAEVTKLCKNGVDLIHVDVMDGHFVPNLTIGPIIIDSVSKITQKPLDIHLMVENNTFFVELLVPFSPQFISFHIESEKHPHRLIQKIKELGIKPAIALNPHTPISSIQHLIEEVDMVLLMSVNPGFGGQGFISEVLSKIKELKELINLKNPHCYIEVDGGVNDTNIQSLKEVGVDIVVSGSYIFKHKDGVKRAILSLI